MLLVQQMIVVLLPAVKHECLPFPPSWHDPRPGDMLREAVKNETPVGMKAKGFMNEVRTKSTNICLLPECSLGYIYTSACI